MKILLLSRYGRMGASSRVRSLQYLPFLESRGWHVEVSPLFSDDYLRSLYSGRSRIFQMLAGYWRRLKSLAHAGKYDLIWIEKEIFPFVPALAEWLLATVGVPYIADYDDALFHRYDRHRRWLIRSLLGRKIDSVMRHAELVIVGSKYLAERARLAGAQQVEIVPTVVDLTRYREIQPDSDRSLVVGWIGSPTTSHYLSNITSVLISLERDFNVRIVAVGASKAALIGSPVEVWPWSEETEVESIQSFDIGIMPLVDSPWERGKCGYKLIQYMACGLPVVASPVGANRQIVEDGSNGFLAQEPDEWDRVLRRLLNDQSLRRRMGEMGRKKVEDWFSLQVQAPRLVELLGKAPR